MRFRFLPCLLLPGLLACSCQSTLEPSGFLGSAEPRMMANPDLPFSRSWKNPDRDLSLYSMIAVRPMRTDKFHLDDPEPSHRKESKKSLLERDARNLATLATSELQSELGRSPNRRVAISDQFPRQEGWMVVETNLVEFKSGRSPMMPVRCVVPFAESLSGPSIGIEGRLLDAASGDILFAFSDLEGIEPSLLDLQKCDCYGIQKRLISRWAGQLRQVVEGDGKTLVRDAFPMQVVNW